MLTFINYLKYYNKTLFLRAFLLKIITQTKINFCKGGIGGTSRQKQHSPANSLCQLIFAGCCESYSSGL